MTPSQSAWSVWRGEEEEDRELSDFDIKCMIMMMRMMHYLVDLCRVDGSYLCPLCELPLCGEKCFKERK